MEISARNSSTKIIAIIILSLTALVFILGFAVTWLAVTNRTLIHEQRTVVTRTQRKDVARLVSAE